MLISWYDLKLSRSSRKTEMRRDTVNTGCGPSQRRPARHLDALPVHPAVVVRQQRSDHRPGLGAKCFSYGSPTTPIRSIYLTHANERRSDSHYYRISVFFEYQQSGSVQHRCRQIRLNLVDNTSTFLND